MSQLRIVTWNIAATTQMDTLNLIADCLRDTSPDIVLLNEACIWNFLYGNVNQITKIAERANYGHWQWTKTATLALKGAKYVAVLSRTPLLSAQHIVHSAYLDGGGYATLHVTARIYDRVHHIFSTRFTAYDGAENARSHATLRDIILGIPSNEAVFIGGDFNTGYDRWVNDQPIRNHLIPAYKDFVVRTRLRHVLGGLGWENASPDDHLLVRGPYTITHAERTYPAEGAASDHPWVLAELSWLDGLDGIPLHDGSVLREAPNPAVYVVLGGAKFWVPNPETLIRLYGGWPNVKVVPATSLDKVPTIPCNGTILREENSAYVWLIEDGKRRHITTPGVLVRYGGWDVVRIVPNNATTNFALGAPVG
jgi:endonuclease/exonuclease/phosphatase family metal-dependent hydrolase